jgi:hypothetical protein
VNISFFLFSSRKHQAQQNKILRLAANLEKIMQKVFGALLGLALMFGMVGFASAATIIGVSNSADITNVSTAVANTGSNFAGKKSVILTGDAFAWTKTINIVNTTFIRVW